jgi:hypothetical protein
MTCVRGHVSLRTAPADEAIGQRLRVTRAIDVREQVLRRSGLGAVAAPAGRGASPAIPGAGPAASEPPGSNKPARPCAPGQARFARRGELRRS